MPGAARVAHVSRYRAARRGCGCAATYGPRTLNEIPSEVLQSFTPADEGSSKSWRICARNGVICLLPSPFGFECVEADKGPASSSSSSSDDVSSPKSRACTLGSGSTSSCERWIGDIDGRQ